MRSNFEIRNGTLIRYHGNDSEVRIPDNVVRIGEKAFKDCSSITKVIIPNRIISIGSYAFVGCSNLTDISIPETTKYIGYHAFECCRNLSSIIIKSSIKSIGRGAFLGCKGLKKFVIDADPACMKNSSSYSDLFIYVSNFNYRILYASMYPLNGIEEFYIPGIDLQYLAPEQKLIYTAYFFSCPKKYSDEEREMYIGYFKYQCKRVVDFILSNNIISSISGILSEKLLSISNTDIFIDKASESGRTEILAMLLDYKNKSFSAEELEREEKRRINRELNYNPLLLTEIKKNWTFSENRDDTIILTSYKGKSTEIIIPESIGDQKVSILGRKALSPRMKYIRNREVRTKITSIMIPEGVKKIEEYALLRCDRLSYIDIPGSITKISKGAFSGCVDLSEINMAEGVREICTAAFSFCGNLKEVNIPDGVCKIGTYAFLHCCNLKSVSITYSVKNIGSDAFTGCHSELIIKAPAGSFAEKYAVKNHINFIPMEDFDCE